MVSVAGFTGWKVAATDSAFGVTGVLEAAATEPMEEMAATEAMGAMEVREAP
jgi:hypothetical protein